MNDKIKKFKDREFSWSCLSSWFWDRDEWYSKYILGIRPEPTVQMLFGNVVGEKLAEDSNYLPGAPRYPIAEKKLTAKLGSIKLLGYLDFFDKKTKDFIENKTSSNPRCWTQKACDEHGQLLFYKLLIYINYKVAPDKIGCKLVYIPVEQGGDFKMYVKKNPIKVFDVKHTTADVLKFAKHIKDTHKEMIDYIKSRSKELEEIKK